MAPEPYLHASNFRISIVVFLTGADWPVVDNLAGGVTATGARVPAEGIDAGRLVATLVISFAAGDDGRQCFAAGLLVRDVPIWTFADHCPKFKESNFINYNSFT